MTEAPTGTNPHSSEEFRSIAEHGTILRCLVGSGVHGTAVEGQDDRDEMGMCIKPAEYVVGELEGTIERLMTDSPLPPNPDRRSADAWLIAAYQDSWSGSAGSAIIGS